jgi:hypothetical protein
MGPELGLRKRPRWVEGVPISRLLAPRMCARDAFSYFPNSLGREILGISEDHSFEGCVDLRERDIIPVGKAKSLGEAGKETILWHGT